jgi:hypothetical protein
LFVFLFYCWALCYAVYLSIGCALQWLFNHLKFVRSFTSWLDLELSIHLLYLCNITSLYPVPIISTNLVRLFFFFNIGLIWFESQFWHQMVSVPLQSQLQGIEPWFSLSNLLFRCFLFLLRPVIIKLD